jgi:hypothetical protein
MTSVPRLKPRVECRRNDPSRFLLTQPIAVYWV